MVIHRKENKQLLNYGNLSDVEFEYLCRDILTRKLNKKFRTFAKGRDGGIDIYFSAGAETIVAQVKHYQNSTISSLMLSLDKEIAKVEELKPVQYFICVSKILTKENIDKIYEKFKKYMDSYENILDLEIIEKILTNNDNYDVLRKYDKLYVPSLDILTSMLSNDIYIDSYSLLSNLEEEAKIFVQTDLYNDAIDMLDKHNILMFIGSPGVGKTITSKMIVYKLSREGYKVKYTSANMEISGLKKSISENRELKEVIFLDDCFGQAYFNMKESQVSELTSLIDYIRLNKNKILILNSRVTIYNEAKKISIDFEKREQEKKFNIKIIDMDKINDLEKAQMFYNHLYGGIEQEYFENIKKDKGYLQIVKHKNFNPRIIEFVTNKHNYEKIDTENYKNYIITNMENPKKIWIDEYENRLNKVDRILLLLLYSLTDVTINFDFIKKLFEKRILKENNIDCSKTNFEVCINRLQNSFIQIIDVNKEKCLSVSNPSVNDFLNDLIQANSSIKSIELEHATYYKQFEKLLDENSYNTIMREKTESLEILDMDYLNESEEIHFITSCVLAFIITKKEYSKYINKFLKSGQDLIIYDNKKIYYNLVLKNFCEEPFKTFYQIENIFNIEAILTIMEREDLEFNVNFINSLIDLGVINESDKELIKNELKDSLDFFLEDIDSNNYNYDIDKAINSNIDGPHGEVNYDGVEQDLKEQIKNQVIDEALDYLSILPKDFYNEGWLNEDLIDVKGSDDIISSYFSDYENDDYERGTYSENFDTQIDYIFNR